MWAFNERLSAPENWILTSSFSSCIPHTFPWWDNFANPALEMFFPSSLSLPSPPTYPSLKISPLQLLGQMLLPSTCQSRARVLRSCSTFPGLLLRCSDKVPPSGDSDQATHSGISPSAVG